MLGFIGSGVLRFLAYCGIATGGVAGLAYADRKMNRVVSKELMDTELGEKAAEGVLTILDAITEEKAVFVEDHLTEYLKSKGKLNEDDPDIIRDQGLVKAASYAASGAPFQSLKELAETTGIETFDAKDLIALDLAAQKKDPEMSLKDRGQFVFEGLQEQLKAKDLQKKLDKEAVIAAGGGVGSTPVVDALDGAKDVVSKALSGNPLSAVFNAAADRAGFVGHIYKFAVAVAGVFIGKAAAQRWALKSMGVSTKFDDVRRDDQNDDLVTDPNSPVLESLRNDISAPELTHS